MSLILGVLKETADGESRVAMVPALIPALKKTGLEIVVEKGAGELSGYPDAFYLEKGAKIVTRKDVLDSDIIFTVRRPEKETKWKAGSLLIGMFDPYEPADFFKQLQKSKVTAFSMELIPRTTRAQSMDVLSSQANLAGYKAVLMAAQESVKMFPMMMTAAGTITASKVFVLGAGVAGLQAIATAKRLGAVVSGYDVRSAVKEQVESLGGKFVQLDIETAEGTGGYAKAMDDAYYTKQRQLLGEVMREMDIVISTAAIPGRKSPLLITKSAVEGMSPGSVIVDLAAERGGNCELSKAGQTYSHKGVKIMAPLNLASTLAYNASALYSKNLVNFLMNMMIQNKETKTYSLTIKPEDDIVAATMLTHEGRTGSEKIKEILGLQE